MKNNKLKQLSYHANEDIWIAYSTESYAPENILTSFAHTVQGSGKTKEEALNDMEYNCTSEGKEKLWKEFMKSIP